MHGARLNRRRGEVGKSGACWCCPAANSSIGISGKIPVPDRGPTGSACLSLGTLGGHRLAVGAASSGAHRELSCAWCGRKVLVREKI